jgi:hypothetical protein
VDVPIEPILAGKVVVQPGLLRGTRVPLDSWENKAELALQDKGVAVGGIQVGVYGWSNGAYFPGGLGYLLLNHPELARHEAPYSLPLLFDEDEWRNGMQTAGFTSRRLKELATMKVYRLTRNRYGLEHHSMFLFLETAKNYGCGNGQLGYSEAQAAAACRGASEAFVTAIAYSRDHTAHPSKFTPLERALLDWTDAVVTRPHSAYQLEPALRRELDATNRAEVKAGVRRLDRSGGLDEQQSYDRLTDSQIAELAMMIGHMDGLGRVFSTLRIEGEAPVKESDGYYTTRPGIIETLQAIQVPPAALTANELLLNPTVNERVTQRLTAGENKIRISAKEALATGEF